MQQDVLFYARNRLEMEAWQDLLAIAFDQGSDMASAARAVIRLHEGDLQTGNVSLRA